MNLRKNLSAMHKVLHSKVKPVGFKEAGVTNRLVKNCKPIYIRKVIYNNII